MQSLFGFTTLHSPALQIEASSMTPSGSLKQINILTNILIYELSHQDTELATNILRTSTV